MSILGLATNVQRDMSRMETQEKNEHYSNTPNVFIQIFPRTTIPVKNDGRIYLTRTGKCGWLLFKIVFHSRFVIVCQYVNPFIYGSLGAGLLVFYLFRLFL